MLDAALKRWRDARAAMKKTKTYENAVELQVAARAFAVARRDAFKVIGGGKT